MKKTKLFSSIAIALGTSIIAPSGMSAQLEEVVVTATKREASTQDIAVAVSAVNGETLEQLNVENFADYLMQLPTVTASSTGPGQGTVFIRGVASSPVFLTVAGSAGLAPNVALYYDEQPVSQVGRNLDVYAADLNRIEVLPGPQGTLFGASSQAGTVRLISNKPDFSEAYGKVSAGFSSTTGGDNSYKSEIMFNLPISDNFAVRTVIYSDQQGGYIDNVPGTISGRDHAAFRSADEVRSNGTPYVSPGNPRGPGFATARQGAVNAQGIPTYDHGTTQFIDGNNTAFLEDNINDASYGGVRIGATYLLNDDWSLSVTHTSQKLDTEGVFFGDPELGSDLTKISRFTSEDSQDVFDNTAWTVEGSFAGLDMVYTGSFLDRETEYTSDYTDYHFVGQYHTIYTCDNSAVYPGTPGAAVPASGTCYSPLWLLNGKTFAENTTHELRFSTSEDNAIRATFGVFFSDAELNEQNDWSAPSAALTDDGAGRVPNTPLAGSTLGNPNARDGTVTFFNDYLRSEEQFGAFAEVTWDITDMFALTFGARSYEVETDLEGSTNLASGRTSDPNTGGDNLNDLFDGNNINERTGLPYPQLGPGEVFPDTAKNEGENYKVSFSFTPTDNQLWYVTFSEGFRPGLLNRPAGRVTNVRIPGEVRTDELTNYELGWKLDLLDGSLRFNGNIFYMEIDDMQTTIFDASIINLFFSDNAADTEVAGLEGDITWAATENLLISTAFSFLDTEIVKLAGIESAVIAPEGSELAYAPEFQGNIRARYTWETSRGLTAHAQLQASYSDSSFSDIVSINRVEQDSYTLLNAAYGVTNDAWSAEFFVENLTDEVAELNNNFNYDRERIAIARPRTVGFRLSFDF